MKDFFLQKSNFRCRENIYIGPMSTAKAPAAPSDRICEKAATPKKTLYLDAAVATEASGERGIQ